MNLESFLRSISGSTFDRLTNPGNAGDGLIERGADILLNKCGIDYCTITYPEIGAADVILILGSGGFCRPWHHNIERVHFYVAKYRRVCIFPATFDFTFAPVANFLRELPPNVIAFCREEVSYNALKTIVPSPERVYLDHDVAFHNDVTAWKGVGIGEINCFRTDSESARRIILERNFDISDMGGDAHKTVILDVLKNFASVNTDRLHVGIAGALLDKQVLLFVNNYHKNRSMFEYSLKRFPNVSLGDDEDYRRIFRAQYAANKYWPYIRILRHIPLGLVMARAAKRALSRLQVLL
jgi:exopolysaccharide biosynthesis predicted pyruvyltransferase EpsI